MIRDVTDLQTVTPSLGKHAADLIGFDLHHSARLVAAG
jgi:hypothetical protein